MRDHLARQQVDRLHVDRHYPVPIVFAEIEHRRPPNDAGVVEQNVDSTELANRTLDQPLAISGSRHIDTLKKNTPAGLRDLVSDSLAFIPIHVRKGDRSSLACE